MSSLSRFIEYFHEGSLEHGLSEELAGHYALACIHDMDSKWCHLHVIGKSVSRDQAAEILLRTDDLMFHTNDRTFKGDLRAIMGLDREEGDWEVDEKAYAKIAQIPLSFMNNSRIVSAHVLGPHGWLDWDGTIWTNNYNLGTYPRSREVFLDLVKISDEFPYLDMVVTLYEDEEATFPAVQFLVKEGGVFTRYAHIEPPRTPKADFDFDKMHRRLTTPGYERGTNVPHFAHHWFRLVEKFGEPK